MVCFQLNSAVCRAEPFNSFVARGVKREIRPKSLKFGKGEAQKAKRGPTGIRTQGAGFKVPSDNRYTIGPRLCRWKNDRIEILLATPCSILNEIKNLVQVFPTIPVTNESKRRGKPKDSIIFELVR